MYDFMLEHEFEFDEFDYTYVSEEATWDTMKHIIETDTKSLRECYKQGDKLFKQKEYDAAIKKYKESILGFQKLKSKIKSTKDDVVGNVCGFLLSSGILQMFFATKVAGVGGALNSSVGPAYTFMAALSGNPALPILTSLAAKSGQITGQLIGNKIVGKKDGSPNSFKEAIITLIDIQINACNAMITACNNAKKMKTESTLFESIFNML